MILPHETRAPALAAVVLLMLAAAGARAATIQTIAGTDAGGLSGDDGPATAAQLFSPQGICRDPAGNIIFADIGNHRVRRIDAATGIITTFAGTNTSGYSGDNGPAIVAQLNSPQSVACDANGNVFLVDMGTIASGAWTARASSPPWRATATSASAAMTARRPRPG